MNVYIEVSLPLRKREQVGAKSIQFKTDCNSLRKKLNSFGRTRKYDLFILISVRRRLF